MKDWYAVPELAGLPGMPGTHRGVRKKAGSESWKSRKRAKGKGREYHIDSLPIEAQAALLMRAGRPGSTNSTSSRSSGGKLPTAGGLPAASVPEASPASFSVEGAKEAYHRATANARYEAAKRLAIVRRVYELTSAGMTRRQACQQAGVPFQTFYRWEAMIRGADSQHWLELLCPSDRGGNNSAPFDREAKDFLRAHWLQRRQPSKQSSINRLREVAAKKGWQVPSDRTLQAYLSRIPAAVTRLAREGVDVTAEMIVSQRRSVASFPAGEIVNGDGLKLDELWIQFEDGEIVNGATCWVNQDVHSRRLLNYELRKTENTDVFRLAIYGLTEICLPKYYFVDNTMAAANKVMTAGPHGRNRFKSDPEDGLGLLLMLDIQPCFTNPDKIFGRPGAKPIERAFRDFQKEIVTNPKLTDRGYSKATAVPVALVREVIDQEMARWNARTKRRTETCRGLLSFDEAWQESARKHPVRQADAAKRRLLLMSREAVTVNRRDGHIRLKSGATSEWGAHRYCSEPLSRLRGEKVIVMFDPIDLTKDVYVYDAGGRYLTDAQHIPNEAFMSEDAAREYRKLKKRAVKAMKIQSEAEAGATKVAMQRAYLDVDTPDGPTAPDTNVTHIGFGRVPDPEVDARKVANADFSPSSEADDEPDGYDQKFERAMRAAAAARKDDF